MANRITVLCVDDEANILMLRQMLLSLAGYSVLTATHAEEALRVLRCNQVDLVITDQLLYGTTGTELAAQMKLYKPKVPIVLMTGMIDPPLDVGHIELVLTKGMAPTNFLSAIAALVSRASSASAGSEG